MPFHLHMGTKSAALTSESIHFFSCTFTSREESTLLPWIPVVSLIVYFVLLLLYIIVIGITNQSHIERFSRRLSYPRLFSWKWKYTDGWKLIFACLETSKLAETKTNHKGWWGDHPFIPHVVSWITNRDLNWYCIIRNFLNNNKKKIVSSENLCRI